MPVVLNVVVGRLWENTYESQWSEFVEPPLEEKVEVVAVVVEGELGTSGTCGNP